MGSAMNQARRLGSPAVQRIASLKVQPPRWRDLVTLGGFPSAVAAAARPNLKSLSLQFYRTVDATFNTGLLRRTRDLSSSLSTGPPRFTMS